MKMKNKCLTLLALGPGRAKCLCSMGAWTERSKRSARDGFLSMFRSSPALDGLSNHIQENIRKMKTRQVRFQKHNTHSTSLTMLRRIFRKPTNVTDKENRFDAQAPPLANVTPSNAKQQGLSPAEKQKEYIRMLEERNR